MSDRFEEKLIIDHETAFHLNGKVKNNNVRHYVPMNVAPEFKFDVRISKKNVSLF